MASEYTTGCLEFSENTLCRRYMKIWVFARFVNFLYWEIKEGRFITRNYKSK